MQWVGVVAGGCINYIILFYFIAQNILFIGVIAIVSFNQNINLCMHSWIETPLHIALTHILKSYKYYDNWINFGNCLVAVIQAHTNLKSSNVSQLTRWHNVFIPLSLKLKNSLFIFKNQTLDKQFLLLA